MLIGARCLHLRGAVHAAFVGEGGAAHIRLVIVWGKVGDLRHLVRKRGEVSETVSSSHLVLALEGEVCHQRDHVGVAGAFAVAVDRCLDVAHACVNRRERIRHGEFCVVM